MKIILVGYGKMGQAIEQAALARGHEIVLRINSANKEMLRAENLAKADVAIEVTGPGAAFENVRKCLSAGVPTISGSTGWNAQLPEAEGLAHQHNTAFLQTSNFSLGVNVFFAINEALAGMMAQLPQYDVNMHEVHHTKKLDSPSGTAITLAERIISGIGRKKTWSEAQPPSPETLSISSERRGEVPGTHIVRYFSANDEIELTHTAKNRNGFAEGAVVAAEFIRRKKGVFSMKDVLGI